MLLTVSFKSEFIFDSENFIIVLLWQFLQTVHWLLFFLGTSRSCLVSIKTFLGFLEDSWVFSHKCLLVLFVKREFLLQLVMKLYLRIIELSTSWKDRLNRFVLLNFALRVCLPRVFLHVYYIAFQVLYNFRSFIEVNILDLPFNWAEKLWVLYLVKYNFVAINWHLRWV